MGRRTFFVATGAAWERRPGPAEFVATLHPPSGRVGNERQRVSGEGCWNTERASIHPPRRLVPRLRPSQGEGEVHGLGIRLEGATKASDQSTV